MKNFLIRITKNVFLFLIGTIMLVSLAVAVGYVIAFSVGPPVAEVICQFFKSYILPCGYISCIFACLVGIANMYLCGKHVFVMDNNKSKNKQ